MLQPLLVLALLNTPPMPPPPPERLAAAAELRRIAPFTSQTREGALHAAVHALTSQALHKTVDPAKDPDTFVHALTLMQQQLSAAAPEVEARGARCIDERLGWAYDLETLQDMARAVATPGGRLLWYGAVKETVQTCYFQAVSDHMSGKGFTGAMAWLAEKKLLGRVRRRDPGATDDIAFARQIETVCGPRARGAVRSQNGRLGIGMAWHEREFKRSDGTAGFCLLVAAKVSGYDLVIFDP